MNYYLKIGKINICIDSFFEIDWDDQMKQFLVMPTDENDMTYHFKATDSFNPIYGQIVYQTSEYTFIYSNNTEYRIYTFSSSGEPYAYSYQVDDRNYDIYFDKNIVPYIKGNRSIFNFITLDKILLKNQSIILHSSYIVYNDEAILFSASSGVGKSTQADLWKKIKGTKIINGDRTLLVYENNQWFACGFPICGSSQICLNEKHPLKSIVFLAQGTENIIDDMSSAQKTKCLYEQLFINTWDTSAVNLSLSVIDSIISNVQVTHYTCTKNDDAVLTLHHYIYN